MKPKEYRTFVNKIAMGLVNLTDAQKANPRIVSDAWAAREQIRIKAENEARRIAQQKAQQDQLPQ